MRILFEQTAKYKFYFLINSPHNKNYKYGDALDRVFGIFKEDDAIVCYDNSTNDLFTEEFLNMKDALDYVNGNFSVDEIHRLKTSNKKFNSRTE